MFPPEPGEISRSNTFVRISSSSAVWISAGSRAVRIGDTSATTSLPPLGSRRRSDVVG